VSATSVYRLTFNDYSGDGKIFLDGQTKVTYLTNENGEIVGTRIKGALKISGKHKVRVIRVIMDGDFAGERPDHPAVDDSLRTAVRVMLSQAIAAGPGIHEGTHSGQVTVEVKQREESGDNDEDSADDDEGDNDEASAETQYRLTFDNYSEDGAIFLNGQLKVVYETEGEQVVDTHIRGELNVSDQPKMRVVRVVLDSYFSGELRVGKS
jgi:hypothetical protein